MYGTCEICGSIRYGFCDWRMTACGQPVWVCVPCQHNQPPLCVEIPHLPPEQRCTIGEHVSIFAGNDRRVGEAMVVGGPHVALDGVRGYAVYAVRTRAELSETCITIFADGEERGTAWHLWRWPMNIWLTVAADRAA